MIVDICLMHQPGNGGSCGSNVRHQGRRLAERLHHRPFEAPVMKTLADLQATLVATRKLGEQLTTILGQTKAPVVGFARSGLPELQGLKAKATRFWERRRVRHLLTGLMACGICGNAYASVGRDYLACVGARTMGVCTHRGGLKRAAVEEAILAVVKERLLTPDAVAAFIASFTEEVNRRRDELLGQRRTVEARLAQTERKLQGLYDAIAEGLRTPGLLGQLQELEAERDRLVASVAEAEPTPVRLHPNLPELYRKEVARLRDALADPLIREGAVEQLRRLMTKVTVRPGENCVDLVVEGALTAMLALGPGPRRSRPGPKVR